MTAARPPAQVSGSGTVGSGVGGSGVGVALSPAPAAPNSGVASAPSGGRSARPVIVRPPLSRPAIQPQWLPAVSSSFLWASITFSAMWFGHFLVVSRAPR